VVLDEFEAWCTKSPAEAKRLMGDDAALSRANGGGTIIGSALAWPGFTSRLPSI
jgi:hypothetical protein